MFPMESMFDFLNKRIKEKNIMAIGSVTLHKNNNVQTQSSILLLIFRYNVDYIKWRYIIIGKCDDAAALTQFSTNQEPKQQHMKK